MATLWLCGWPACLPSAGSNQVAFVSLPPLNWRDQRCVVGKKSHKARCFQRRKGRTGPANGQIYWGKAYVESDCGPGGNTGSCLLAVIRSPRRCSQLLLPAWFDESVELGVNILTLPSCPLQLRFQTAMNNLCPTAMQKTVSIVLGRGGGEGEGGKAGLGGQDQNTLHGSEAPAAGSCSELGVPVLLNEFKAH